MAYTLEEQKGINLDMATKAYNDQKQITEEELIKDANWIEASKNIYKWQNGIDYEGDDESIAKEGLEQMSKFNFNLAAGTVPMALKLEDADDETKANFLYMMDTYDNKDISMNGTLRALKQMGLDPTTYIGIGTLGYAFAGKEAVRQGAKTGIKAMLKKGATKYAKSVTAVSATEAGIYTGVDDLARQEVEVQAGAREEIDATQTAITTAVGATIGAAIPEAVKGINKMIKKGTE